MDRRDDRADGHSIDAQLYNTRLIRRVLPITTRTCAGLATVQRGARPCG